MVNINRSLGFIRDFFRTSNNVRVSLEEEASPVISMENFLFREYLSLDNVIITAAAGDVVTTAVDAPAESDVIVSHLSVSLAVARAIQIQIRGFASADPGPLIYNNAAAPLAILRQQTFGGIIIPAGWNLRVTVFGMSALDGNGNIYLMKVTVPRDGPLLPLLV